MADPLLSMFDVIPWWRWVLVILFFGGLGAFWWWSKMGEIKTMLAGKKGPGPRLKIVERRYAGPKATILLVEVDGQSFLLAQTGAAAAWQPLTAKPSVPEITPDVLKSFSN